MGTNKSPNTNQSGTIALTAESETETNNVHSKNDGTACSNDVTCRTLVEKKKTESDVQLCKAIDDKCKKKAEIEKSWKTLFKPPPIPVCSGHEEKCLLRTVKKPGPNLGRQFYVCNRPDGALNNSEAKCNYFKWKTERKENNFIA